MNGCAFTLMQKYELYHRKLNMPFVSTSFVFKMKTYGSA
ncbi:hypothetical protein MY7_0879 [Bacillus sp. CN2]|nr:hypothetical protein MY7_0879 [Bacillus sp. 5B6]GFR54200.1 hypothetical protein MY7_0879 [Bacillus sp. CN2]